MNKRATYEQTVRYIHVRTYRKHRVSL